MPETESAGRHAALGHLTVLRTVTWAALAVVTPFAVWRAVREPLGAPLPTRANATLTPGQDFRDATYYPVRELLRGGVPYDPQQMFAHWPVGQEFDLYTPEHLLLHLPFAVLPYRVGLACYLVVLLAALGALVVVGARAAGLPGGRLAVAVATVAVVLSQLGKSAVYLGQVNPLVALGAVLALLRFGDAPRLAAAGLALAWIKPQYGIPLTVLLLVRGGAARRTGLTGTLLAGALSLPVLVPVVVAAGGVGGFVDVVRRNVAYAAATPYAALDNPNWSRVDLGAVLFRLTGHVLPAVELASLAVVLGAAAWAVGRRHRRGRPFDLAELGVVACATLICLVHQQGESLITMPVVLGAVAAWWAWWAGDATADAPPTWPVTAAAAVLVVPALHVSAAAAVVRAVLGDRADTLVDGLSLLAAFALALTAVAQQSRRDHAIVS